SPATLGSPDGSASAPAAQVRAVHKARHPEDNSFTFSMRLRSSLAQRQARERCRVSAGDGLPRRGHAALTPATWLPETRATKEESWPGRDKGLKIRYVGFCLLAVPKPRWRTSPQHRRLLAHQSPQRSATPQRRHAPPCVKPRRRARAGSSSKVSHRLLPWLRASVRPRGARAVDDQPRSALVSGAPTYCVPPVPTRCIDRNLVLVERLGAL